MVLERSRPCHSPLDEDFCREPIHPLAGDLATHRLTDFRYHRDLTGGSHLDLTLVSPGGEVRRLRFINPSGIQVRGCLPSLVGPEVRNVSGRGWDGVRVVARCCCCSEGSLCFWAEEVVVLANSTS